MKIRMTKTDVLKKKPDPDNLGFGRYFTDYMFTMDWDKTGWHNAQIMPYGNLELSPASTVFHYGAEVFEGMKAYRRPDGGVQLFRPQENARRIRRSAERIRIPQVPEDIFIEAVEKLVALEKDWVPSEAGTTLYIRPFVIGTDQTLGVHTITSGKFVIILSPVGSYYPEGLNPVRIMIETTDVRAVRGGTGYTKCGGNYAAATRAAEEAEKKGFTQVLWLDGVERRYIEEVGAMNVMFRIDDTIVTPSLKRGSILSGVTRMSIIDLAREWGIKVEERDIDVNELLEAVRAGRLQEAWGCGTAAVVSPIGELSCFNTNYLINGGKTGDWTRRFYDELTGIQYGTREDVHNWTVRVA